MRRLLIMAAALLAVAGCAKGERTQAKELTQRQRDSILATEPLPGAGVVGSALKASDRAASDAERLNAAVDSLPR